MMSPSASPLPQQNKTHHKKSDQKLVICLLAPTASGKTALAYELYDTRRFELISIDSALIYRDMNIGTAKPTSDELARYPHYMVDIVDPHDTFSVAQFVEQVAELIETIHARGKIPLLVGGTMMYFNAMFTGLSPVPATHPDIRTEVEVWRNQVGLEALYEHLQVIDPPLGASLKPNDTQRITRAIEVYRQTGKPLSDWQALPMHAIADNPSQKWLGLAIMPERAWLHERIAKRLEMMWDEGFVDEVMHILESYPVKPDDPAMRCVGYRQVVKYLRLLEQCDLTESEKIDAQIEMQNKALYATRQLAKRQYTWLRNLTATHGIRFGLATHPLAVPFIQSHPSYNPHRFEQKMGKVILAFKSMTQADAYLQGLSSNYI